MTRPFRNIDYDPPVSAKTFLYWFCSARHFEELEGDLLERFETRKLEYSKFINQFLFWIEVLGFLRPVFWKNNLFENALWGLTMFRMNLKFAIRNIYKNFFFSSMNISGLAIGIACVLLIFFYIQNELSYDKFNEKGDRIYRVLVDGQFSGNNFKEAESGGIVGPTMLKDFPEVETFVRLDEWGIYYVRYEDTSFKENTIISADSTFFDVFTVPVLVGNANDLLTNPTSVAISRRAAEKYFGEADPTGKPLNFDERETYYVSGVFENIPKNSHFEADFIISNASRKNIDQDGWTNNNYYTYVLLRQNASIKSLEAKMPGLMENYGWPEIRQFGLDVDKLLASGVYWNFLLQPLSDFHFNTEYRHSLKPTTDIKYIYIFGIIAIIILLIASINFVNLSTAKSAGRAKEVGIKKVIGSVRGELINQFLTESVVISLISLVIALFLVELLKPIFFEILGSSFEISYLDNLGFGIALVTLIIFVGIVAGSFPAFVLSKFLPVVVLRGNMQNAMKKGWFRSSLVVFQFSTSLVLIIGTLVVFNQLEYMHNKNLGYDKERLLIIDDPYILGDKSEIFKERMLQNPSVESATISGYLPVDSYRGNNGFWRDGDMNDPKIRPHQRWTIDYDYFSTLDIKIVEGRNFLKEFSTDKDAIIINRACKEYSEWNEAVGHSLMRGTGQNEFTSYTVIGVVEDFHFQSLRNEIEPIVFQLGKHDGYATFKISGNLPAVLEYAENLWKELEPSKPFSFQFMDEAYNKEYKNEESMLSIFKYFAFLAVSVGCLGLFGLSAFAAEKRTKEIGIRKVHGARILNLIYLLSREFAFLVVIAIVVASPIAYFVMDGWLEGYAYRTDLGAGSFILASAIALTISLLTVSYHAIKASLLNPVQSLKCE